MAHQEEAGASAVQCGIKAAYNFMVELGLHFKTVIKFVYFTEGVDRGSIIICYPVLTCHRSHERVGSDVENQHQHRTQSSSLHKMVDYPKYQRKVVGSATKEYCQWHFCSAKPTPSRIYMITNCDTDESNKPRPFLASMVYPIYFHMLFTKYLADLSNVRTVQRVKFGLLTGRQRPFAEIKCGWISVFPIRLLHH